MIGRDPNLVVTPEDDGFHRPESDDPSWIETIWFPFFVPEEAISASIRVRLSPNLAELEATIEGIRSDLQKQTEKELKKAKKKMEEVFHAHNCSDTKALCTSTRLRAWMATAPTPGRPVGALPVCRSPSRRSASRPQTQRVVP